MPGSQILLIARWVLPLWLLGWLVLPGTSRLFSALPDKGLAAGRFLALVLLTLFCFWGASLHVLSLVYSPVFFIGVPLLLALGYKNPELRKLLWQNRRALLLSDLIFLFSFGFFLWLRCRYPEANNLEKPMDMALLAAAGRTHFLPFENFWFSGTPFTNYYYFGPLLGALTARTLATPPWFAYNLVQPAICAFFLSVLWSLAGSLCKSIRWGIVVMLLVGCGGNLEPLRQIWLTHKLWPIDWWSTSRVIPDTINEYPAFTLGIGDAHAHFYGLAVAALLLAAIYSLFQAKSKRHGLAMLVLCGVLLGTVLLCNTWDAPCYALLLWFAARNSEIKLPRWKVVVAVFLAPLTAAPYFARFTPQIKGGMHNTGLVFQPWLPGTGGFLLYWGSWLLLALLAYLLWHFRGEPQGTNSSQFCRLLVIPGLIALFFPYVFYIRGYMGDGGFRHMDTVFKFGLQAWLLLGLAIGVRATSEIRLWYAAAKKPRRALAQGLAVLGAAILTLAPAGVVWARGFTYATPGLSLNAMRYLPQSQQDAIVWLRGHALLGQSCLENVPISTQGIPQGDYDPSVGAVAAFSGVPTYLGWPQHAMYWGASWPQVQLRSSQLTAAYGWPAGKATSQAVALTGASYIFVGYKERAVLTFGRAGHSILDQFTPCFGSVTPSYNTEAAKANWQAVILAVNSPEQP